MNKKTKLKIQRKSRRRIKKYLKNKIYELKKKIK